MHLPLSTYHYTAVSAGMAFGSGPRRFFLEAGSTPLAEAHGISQWIGYLGGGPQWQFTGAKILSPFLGVGGGIYFDKVGDRLGWVPSLMTRGGLKLGFEGFGLTLALASYIGIYDPLQLVKFTAWPFTVLSGGIYARF